MAQNFGMMANYGEPKDKAKNATTGVAQQLEGHPVTRVNSANVLDEGLRIGEIGRRMNSKVKLVEICVYRK
jgi:hypothetical protein